MRRWLIAVLALFVASTAQAEQGATGQVLSLKTAFGGFFDAYASGPEDADRAVLLLHDRFGMSSQVRDWADRFAAQGYRALAIDMYDGRRATSWKHATSVMVSIDPVWAEADIAAAIRYLDPGKRKVVIVGWDYGATQALLATLQAPESVVATVVFYPTALETDQNRLQTIANPVLVVVAERDQQLATPQILAFKDGMSKTRVDFNVMAVDAERGFTNPIHKAYSADATQTVWDVTQEFLARYVPSQNVATPKETSVEGSPPESAP